MSLIDELTVVPPPDNLPLLGYVVIGTLLLHIPYMGVLLGCTIVSLTANAAGKFRDNSTYRRFARDVIAAVAGRVELGLALGFLPQVILILTFSQVYFERRLFRVDIHSAVPPLVILGIVFAYAYKRAVTSEKVRFEISMILGTAAAGLLMLGLLIFYGGMEVIHNPDSWTFSRAPVEFILASSVTPDYLRFLTLSIGLAGGWILFLYFGWPEVKKPRDGDYLSFMRIAAIVMVGAFVLTGPLLTLWHGLAAHPAAVSPTSLTLSALSILALVVTGLALYAQCGRPGSRIGLSVFPLLIVSYLASAIDGQVLRANATVEHRLIVEAEGERVREELMARLEETGDATSPERGRQIFETRCMACHRFDTRLVGPPLATVLPKYAGKREELGAFLDYPSKVNPDYPAMPRLGLRRTEIEAVSNYVLQRYEEEYGTQ